MVASTYDTAMVKGVFPHEGGWTNDPLDPGKGTNWGITIFDARKYWKPNATNDDVRNMPKSVAEDIYAKHYAAPLRYSDLPAGVDYAVLDYGINSGIARAARVLRACVGANDSGTVISDAIIALVRQRDPVRLIKAIDSERLKFLMSLSTWNHFGKGWMRRVNEVDALACAMANGAALAAPASTPKPAGETMAKGQHPTPKVGKRVAQGAGTVVAAGAAKQASSGGVMEFIQAHPGATALIAAIAVTATLIVTDLIITAHRNKQVTPMPGTAPVPVAA